MLEPTDVETEAHYVTTLHSLWTVIYRSSTKVTSYILTVRLVTCLEYLVL